MTTQRETISLNGIPGPVRGDEERSDEPPRTGAPAPRTAPDPEVVAKPKRRQFTAAYRLRVLEEADRCPESGEVGRLLRREGLYSSHLTAWRKALDAKVRELEAKVIRLEKALHTAHTILDVQGKVAGLLGFSLKDGKDC